MKCHVIYPDYGCPTHTGCTWWLTRDDRLIPRQHGHWDPVEDAHHGEGPRGWLANGPLTDDTLNRLRRLWAWAPNARVPLSGSHVIGYPQSGIYPDTIVDQAFVAAVQALAQDIYSFAEVWQVWDPAHAMPPWEGRFFVASILQRFPSYDLHLSQLGPAHPRFAEHPLQYGSSGPRRVVRASTIAGHVLWRDTYTRDVLCTDAFANLLAGLGVTAWGLDPVELIDDRH